MAWSEVTVARTAEIVFAPDSTKEDRDGDVLAMVRLLSEAELSTVFVFNVYEDEREVEVET